MDYYDIIIEKLLFIAIVLNAIVLCCKIYEFFMLQDSSATGSAAKKSSSSTSVKRKSEAESRKKLQDEIEKTEMSNVDDDLKKYFHY